MQPLSFASLSRLDMIKAAQASSYIISGLISQDLLETANQLASSWGIEGPNLRIINPESDKLKISITQIKQFKADRQHKAYSGELTIIEHPDKLSPEASNALLKELEEPGEYKYTLLLAQNPSKLLSTIRSRLPQISLSYQHKFTQSPNPYTYLSIIDRLKLVEQSTSKSQIEALTLSISAEISESLSSSPQDLSTKAEDWYQTVLEVYQDLTVNLNAKLLLTRLSIIDPLL